MPNVTVLMPVYNGEKYVRHAIESILGQTYDDFEFVIVDDGSTDRTIAIVRSFDDPRIVLLSNEANLGIVESLNRGIRIAQGTYICRMDADDIAMPNRVERQVRYLEEHPEVAAVGSNTLLVDEQGCEIGQEDYPHLPQEVHKTILTHNPFAHATMMVRRSILENCGTYDKRFLYNEDYDLWLRIASRSLMANLREPLVKRRLHSESISSAREIDLVRSRIRTLAHAIFRYYRKPYLTYVLVRPLLAYWYRRMRRWLRP